MGGIFGVASKNSCTLDLFFGVDYHSHLGTKRGGMAVYGSQGFTRSIHNIENTPFRTKFDGDLDELEGTLGIGCISDNEPQPLLIQSHLGSFAITTVGKINNEAELVASAYENGHIHFMEMSHGRINATELVAALINQKSTLVEGILYAQEKIEGSISILLLTPEGIYASRDKFGRTPIVIGHKDDAYCASFESFAYINLGYTDYKELGPGEIVYMTPESVETVSPPREEMKICSFLWVYYGYPTSSYEGINVESMRYECGKLLAKRDDAQPEVVAGIPDSGIAHAIGYAMIRHSVCPSLHQVHPHMAALLHAPEPGPEKPDRPHEADSCGRADPRQKAAAHRRLYRAGHPAGETTEFLYQSGAKEVHIRPACPPLMFGCPYLNFSRSTSELDLITRRIIRDREGDNVSRDVLNTYTDPDSANYKEMIEEIRKRLGFTTLRYHRLG
mgnify:CR=1 FL=1